MCAKLLLRGETQQLDRLLEALAKRWYECNPENGMKDPGTHLHETSLTLHRCRPRNFIFHLSPQHRSAHRRHLLFPKNDPATIRPQHNGHNPLSTPPKQTHQHRPSTTPNFRSQGQTHCLSLCLVAESVTSSYYAQFKSIREFVTCGTGSGDGEESLGAKSRSWRGET